MFTKAKWIWVTENPAANCYGEFVDTFVWNGKKTVCKISCDGDYTLYINGSFVESNQYGDFEWYKSVDFLDITKYLRKGNNRLAVLVWHFGESTQRYLKGDAGLIYEVLEENEVKTASGEKTLARYSLAYQNGYRKALTPQLGFSYLYDATKEDGWISGEEKGFHGAIFAQKQCQFIPRPIEKLKLLSPVQSKTISCEGKKRFVIDLQAETVGLLSFALFSKEKQKILISFGENLENGQVRRLIGGRDFSVEYIAKEGQNEYVNYMLRLGCRYLQFDCEKETDLQFATLIPQVYSVKKKAYSLENPLDEAIYGICLNSLSLCMMEHYVDCPWREQCLYAFDSRNQMLCGYYAFEGENYDYVKSNLLLMSEDRYPGGLMAISYPCGIDLTIPSFCLYYTLSVKEYIEYSGDTSIAEKVLPRIKKYIDAILAREKDGLLYRFAGANNWNFYDWSPHSEGVLHGEDVVIPDAQLNILAVIALKCLKEICQKSGLEYGYGNKAEELTEKIYETFFNRDEGLFSVTKGGKEFVELVNALAVAFGIAKEEDAEKICEKLAKDELISSSLSVKCFKYDALLKVDGEKYREAILADIRKNYKRMLDSGSTATWETIDGAVAFENAGSLCHGWTAIPIYYYYKFGMVR